MCLVHSAHPHSEQRLRFLSSVKLLVWFGADAFCPEGVLFVVVVVVVVWCTYGELATREDLPAPDTPCSMSACHDMSGRTDVRNSVVDLLM